MFEMINSHIKDIFQWSQNVSLTFSDCSIGDEIHFSNDKKKTALVKKLNDSLTTTIPNILLQESKPIEVFICKTIGEEQLTLDRDVIRVIPRAKPDDYVYTEDEIYNYKTLSDKIDSFNTRLDEYEKERDLTFFSLDEAQDYAKNNPNIGQQIMVIDTINGEGNLYTILSDTGELYKLTNDSGINENLIYVLDGGRANEY